MFNTFRVLIKIRILSSLKVKIVINIIIILEIICFLIVVINTSYSDYKLNKFQRL